MYYKGFIDVVFCLFYFVFQTIKMAQWVKVVVTTNMWQLDFSHGMYRHTSYIHTCKNKQSSFTTPETRHGWVSSDGIITVPTHSAGHSDLLWVATHLEGQIVIQSTPQLCDRSSSGLGPFVTTALASPCILFLFPRGLWLISLHFSAHGLDSCIIRDVYKQLQLSFLLTWTLFPLGKPLQLSPALTSVVLQQGKRVVKALDFGPISQTLLIKKEMMTVYVHLAGVLLTSTHRAEGTATVMRPLLLCSIPVVIKKITWYFKHTQVFSFSRYSYIHSFKGLKHWIMCPLRI